MRISTGFGTYNGLHRQSGIEGPWPCSECGELTQYADITRRVNRIFCKNQKCDFTRIIDKANHRIIENDGTHWVFDSDGNKRQVTPV